ncbi:MAG: hypothetical protein GX591_00935, partial [Planctomycetes bacterium]|nr:hypothetical protein [Planctomycetota bacterium]
MGAFILRRLAQSVVTVLGVMVVTFLLFRGVAGDIAAAHLGARAEESQKADWRRRHGYDRPLLLNVHDRFVLTDHSAGDRPFQVRDAAGVAGAVDAMALVPVALDDDPRTGQLAGRYAWGLSSDSPLEVLTASAPAEGGAMRIQPSGGEAFEVDLAEVRTVGDLADAIRSHPDNAGRVTAEIR